MHQKNRLWIYVMIFGIFLFAIATHIYDSAIQPKNLPPISVFYIMLISSLVGLGIVVSQIDNATSFIIGLTILIMTFLWHRLIFFNALPLRPITQTPHPDLTGLSLCLIIITILIIWLGNIAYLVSPGLIIFLAIYLLWIAILFHYIILGNHCQKSEVGEEFSYSFIQKINETPP